MRKAVYAGSFDPITNGHLWMIERGAGLFDELVVAIGINPDKKPSFTLDERVDILKKTTREFSNVSIDTFEMQYLVRYAESVGAHYVLRGIRDAADYGYERGMRHINSDLMPGVDTIFLMPPREISEISSSLVKGLIFPKGWEEVIEGYVPKPVYNKFLQKCRGNFSRWVSLWRNVHANGDPKDIYDKLIAAYSEQHRSYHDLVHITHALRESEQARHLEADPEAVDMAIWFHDAVYDTHAKDNEEKSAQMAYDSLKQAGLAEPFAKNVSSLILATKHNEIPDKDDAKVLVDIDLSILGKAAREFDEYERDIGDEYSWVPEEQFRKGRKALLKDFLKRQNIYLTGLFREKYEQQARANLERALGKLG